MIYRIYYEGKRKFALPVENREQLMALRNAEENLRHLAKAQQGDQGEKAALLQLAYNLGHVGGALAGCRSIGSYFFHDVDCYGEGAEGREVNGEQSESESLKELILSKKDEIGLVMLERSASGGWHLVCKRVPGTTILENQVRVATILRLEMDTSAKDLQRVVFSTSGSPDDLPYLDDCLFGEPMSKEECEAEYKRLKLRERNGQEQVPAGAKKANKHYRPWVCSSPESGEVRRGLSKETTNGTNFTNEHNSDEETTTAVQTTPTPPNLGGENNTAANTIVAPSGAALDLRSLATEGTQERGAAGSARILFIARGVMKEKGLVESDFIEEGGRHTSVKMLLSGATQLLTKDEMNRVLQELMPHHWKDQNIQQLVDDFYQNYTNPSQRLLKYQEELFTKSRRLSVATDANPSASALPPEMPKKLPALIKLLTSNTPDIYKPAVSHAVFPSLGAHLHRVRFRYIDNVEHEATLMNVLMAETGAGKDCITEPINHIIADIRRRDNENLAREKAWKDEVNSRGANKDRQKRPEGLVIQEIDPDVTHAAFVQRMDEADEHFLYLKMNEIEQFDALKGNGKGGQQFQIMCLAFDHNNRYGQTRIGTQSVTAKVCVRLNWNATTTVNKGFKYFERVLTDGPVSRINFCTIPEREIGADIPIYGTYDAQFDEELRPYIERLCAARGIVECPQAFRLAKKLQQECAEFSRLSQSRTYENFTFRALVIAYLKACVLYIAHNYKWDKTIEDFIRWSLEYDLWCKMHFFGEAIDKANKVSHRSTRGPRNLLELLPNEFTVEDAVQVRREQGLPSDSAQQMIRVWHNRGYIEQKVNEQTNTILYVKLKYKN